MPILLIELTLWTYISAKWFREKGHTEGIGKGLILA